MYARKAAGPGVVIEAPRTIAGRDLEKGGTWSGVTATGLFVGVTNQRSYGLHDDSLASRGQMVLDALATGTVEGVEHYLRSIDAREYNAFNVLFGDARALRVAYARRDDPRVAIENLAAGTWILANDRIGSPDFPKTARATELARPLATTTLDTLAKDGRALLADHELPPLDRVPEPPPGSPFPRGLLKKLQAICIHTQVYGTRSASLVAMSTERVERYLFADGPPCVTDFEDVTSMLSG
jgi:uncharacterized protein with NRDE domain